MKEPISILAACGQNKYCDTILEAISNQAELYLIGSEKDLVGLMIKSANCQPDIIIFTPSILLNITLEDFVKIIRRRSPLTRLITVCENEDAGLACAALKAGASAVLSKKTDVEKIAAIVKIVFYGGYYVSSSVSSLIFGAVCFFNRFPGHVAKCSKLWVDLKTNYGHLSTTERGIIASIAQGFSDLEIADKLHFSPGTVRNYITVIKRKTKLKTRTQLAVYALVYGLISYEKIHFLKQGAFHGGKPKAKAG
ncbi:MAG: response regulator transcription factor [Spirochaetes bacterium]|nr:response regulator transcription factor [Spirochaetota bacterium]